MKKIFFIILIIIISGFLFNAVVVYGQDLGASTTQNVAQTGFYKTDVANDAVLNIFVGQIIAMVLGFLGLVFLGLVIYSGIQWMTAEGNEEKVTKARTKIIQAVIGLAIVLLSYVITYYVFDFLGKYKNDNANLSFVNKAMAAPFLDNYNQNLHDAGQTGTYDLEKQENEYYINDLIGIAIKTIISLVGLIFLVLIIYSGIQWMTANGNEDKVSKAKARIINSAIGLFIAIIAMTITVLFFDNFTSFFLTQVTE